MPPELRVGRIHYINVLPIYYALERAYVANGFEMVPGTPAELNGRLFRGEVEVSAISFGGIRARLQGLPAPPRSFHQHRRRRGQRAVFRPDPFPAHRPGSDPQCQFGHFAALLKVLLYEIYGVQPLYRAAPVADVLPDGTYGLLAIGDEALRLKTGRYPYYLDLGRAWHDLTGLPFVFGVWAA